MLSANVDGVEHPELLLVPLYAADSSAWLWSQNGCSALADMGDVRGLALRVNEGLTGLDECTARAAFALAA
jgi:putative chitinase